MMSRAEFQHEFALDELQENAHLPEVQQIIREEIYRGRIRVTPAPSGELQIIPVGGHRGFDRYRSRTPSRGAGNRGESPRFRDELDSVRVGRGVPQARIRAVRSDSELNSPSDFSAQ
jgi:hypothetical protein